MFLVEQNELETKRTFESVNLKFCLAYRDGTGSGSSGSLICLNYNNLG